MTENQIVSKKSSMINTVLPNTTVYEALKVDA